MNKAASGKLAGFFSKYKLLKYKKGEHILRADDPIFGIHLLKSGFVRQYSISSGGHELTIQVYKPGFYFPTLLVIANLPNRYYFEAVTDVELRRSPSSEMINFIKNEPVVLFDFINRFSDNYYELVGRLENLVFEQSYFRVVSVFSYIARRLGTKKGNKIIIKLPLTHEDIASWTGMNRETASRQIEKLIVKGLIGQKGHNFIVPDIKKLELEADGVWLN